MIFTVHIHRNNESHHYHHYYHRHYHHQGHLILLISPIGPIVAFFIVGSSNSVSLSIKSVWVVRIMKLH